MTMRIGAVLSAWLALGAPAVARAGSAYLQNDAFTGSSQVNASANFEPYNGAAVWLGTPDGGGYPVTLTGIAVFYVPVNGAGYQEAFELEVYSAADGGMPAGTATGDIYSDHANGTVVAFDTSTSNFNVFNLPSPAQVNGPVFVRLKKNYAYDDIGYYYSGTIATDGASPVAGANWWWNNATGTYEDLATPDAGFPAGNWIIRGVIAAPDADGGSGTTTSTSSSSGSSGSSGSTGSSSTTGSSGSATTGGTGTTGGATTGAGTTSSGTTGAGGTTGAVAPTLTSVSPNSAFSGDDTQVTLIGSNFQFGIQAVIGPSTLSNPDLKSPALLQGTLLHGTAPGTYDVTIVNPDGQQATLHHAFTVQAGSGGSGSSGGTTAGGTNGAKSGGCGCSSTSDALLLGLPVLLLGLRRRRR